MFIVTTGGFVFFAYIIETCGLLSPINNGAYEINLVLISFFLIIVHLSPNLLNIYSIIRFYFKKNFINR